MRAVTAGLFTSVDGVVADPHLFQGDSFDDDLGRGMDAMIARTDTVVLGRTSYQEWSQYWPGNTGDGFGSFINPVRKFVASRTLTGPLDWQNSSLIQGDLLDFVRELKQGEGGEIAVTASISVVRQLLFAGLLDRLMLMVHPVVAGAGRHLFEPTDPPTRLTLLKSEITAKGNAVLEYGLRTD
ncbi:dihydrofolate reductase family protein [Nakamurella flavida]|uniref:Dihydrofolate reductase family protein n=1 Tax=Nakamurella flavida TaxID=363630 RepID=A0A938YF86_9ACTN|nr:dihydrofolate reductase family protein [Nakamurella flavida]MBM9476586.1 dihydrofolate reductase family protein [Nakamurella flavida]MDP9778976.1 dihydrofolate reductase [Nakamurella flavida]